MIQPTYKRGHILVWVGFLGLFLGNGIRVISGMDALGTLVYLLCFVLFVWGNLLVIKSKNRSWAWIFLILIPPVIGAIWIFMLKDKSQLEAAPAVVQSAPPQ